MIDLPYSTEPDARMKVLTQEMEVVLSQTRHFVPFQFDIKVNLGIFFTHNMRTFVNFSILNMFVLLFPI